jgi:hypothetical protein
MKIIHIMYHWYVKFLIIFNEFSLLFIPRMGLGWIYHD